jgi:hypothetical protein
LDGRFMYGNIYVECNNPPEDGLTLSCVLTN